ncbi:MAG: hypothetical protein WBA51_20050 [Erythrobacter sp.]
MAIGSFFGQLGSFLVVCVLLVLAACVAPASYAGVSLVPGEVDLEIQVSASRAQAGSKQAQLEFLKGF